MKANNPNKTWTSGPIELLDHASSHLTEGEAFDFRITMISIDNAVELAIKNIWVFLKESVVMKDQHVNV